MVLTAAFLIFDREIAERHFIGGPLRVSSSSASRSGSVAVVAMSRSRTAIHSGSSWA
jgi:hypothetical protein